MRIRSEERIAGVPILEVRNALRKLRGAASWSEGALASYLKSPPSPISPLLKKLGGLGYIEPSEEGRCERDAWKVSELGWRFANATATRAVSRRTAERMVRDFLSRVEEVNGNSYYLYQVREVIAFGSYLTDCPTLGDVDLAVTLEPRDQNADCQRAKDDERAACAIRQGRRFSTYVDQLFWAQQEVLLRLKGRSRYVKIHSGGDGVLARTRTKVLFP